MIVFNYDKHCQYWVKKYAKQPVLITLVRVLIYPIKTLYDTFLLWKEQIDARLNLTGQTIVLECFLNNLYDPVDRGIVIQNAPPSPVIFTDIPSEPVIFTDIPSEPVIFTDGKTSADFHFTVIVPEGILTADQEQMIKSSVQKVKVAGFKPRFMYDNSTEF